MSNMRSNIQVTLEQIDRLIQEAEVTTETRFGKVTVVCVKLVSGFVITEAAGCVDPANYSQETGFEICMERIKNKLWELEGYALQKKVADGNVQWPIADLCCSLCFGRALEAAKLGHKIARRGWNGKSQYVELADCISYRNFEGKTVNAAHQAIGNKALAFVGTSGVQMGWLASQADMLAEDWYLVD